MYNDSYNITPHFSKKVANNFNASSACAKMGCMGCKRSTKNKHNFKKYN